MKWITRERIQVNRTATCWLIRRFLDSESEFLFVAPDKVESMQTKLGATGFDARGATYPHQDGQGLCSFAALVRASGWRMILFFWRWPASFKQPTSKVS